MTKLFSALATLALIVSMSSCAKEDVFEAGEQVPFKARLATGKTTRALTEINTLTDTVITVYAVNLAGGKVDMDPNTTGVQDVFYMKALEDTGTDVQTYSDPAGTTPHSYYLPGDGSTVFFFAYVQSGDPAAGITPTFAGGTTAPSVSFTYNNDVESELICSTSSGDNTTSSINFVFDHIVSQVCFKVSDNTSSTNDLHIEVTGIKLFTPASVPFEIAMDAATISPDEEDYVAIDDEAGVTLSIDGANSDSGANPTTTFASAFVLPYETIGSSTGAYMKVSYRIYDSAGDIDTITDKVIYFKDVASTVTTWAVAKRNYYTFMPTIDFAGRVSVRLSDTVWTDVDAPEPIEPSEHNN